MTTTAEILARIDKRLKDKQSANVPVTEKVVASAGANPVRDPTAGLTAIQKKMYNIGGAYGRGEQTLVETVLQGAGQVVNQAVEPFGKLMSSYMSMASKMPFISTMSYEKGRKMADTPLGQEFFQAMQSGVEAYKEFAQTHPRFMRNIEAGIQLGSAIIPYRHILKSTVDDIITPHPSVPNSKLAGSRKFTADWQGARKYNFDAREKAMAQEVSRVPGISVGNTHAMNNEIINKAIGNIEKNLQLGLANSPATYSYSTLAKRVRVALERNNKTLIKSVRLDADDIDTVVDDVVSAARMNSNNPAGLLTGRRLLDNNFSDLQKRRFVNDSFPDTKKSIGWEKGREVMNQVIEEMSPGSRQQLRKMSLLIDANDRVFDKMIRYDETWRGQLKRGTGIGGPMPIRFNRGGT